jgi:hypothetical protein
VTEAGAPVEHPRAGVVAVVVAAVGVELIGRRQGKGMTERPPCPVPALSRTPGVTHELGQGDLDLVAVQLHQAIQRLRDREAIIETGRLGISRRR